jgi:hypothetical protein
MCTQERERMHGATYKRVSASVCACVHVCVHVRVRVRVRVRVHVRVRVRVCVCVCHVLAVTLLSLCSLCFELLDASRPHNLHFLKLVLVHPVQLLQLLVNLSITQHEEWRWVMRAGGEWREPMCTTRTCELVVTSFST